LTQRKPRGLDTDASCHAARRNRGLVRLCPSNTKGLFHTRRTYVAAFQARSAFHRWIPPATTLLARVD